MAQDLTKPETWTVGEITLAASGEHSSRRLLIPKFQRTLVWKEAQKSLLIASIYSGFPIGSLLVHRQPGTRDSKEEYRLVDGLQRTQALIEYQRAPLRWFPVEQAPPDLLGAIGRALGDGANAQAARDLLEDWLRRTGQLTAEAGFERAELLELLVAESSDPSLRADGELKSVLGTGLDKIRESADLGPIQIPVLVFTGNESDIPEIFERINTSGTKLSKYEILSASWATLSGTSIANAEIRSAIQNRYIDLVDKDFNIAGFDPDGQITDFNLFEYLFGLGRLLADRYSLLFTSPVDASSTETAGFSIATVALGLTLHHVKDLAAHMPRASDGLIDPSALESAVIESTGMVERVLRPFLGLRLSMDSSSRFIPHGETQLVSMIVRALVGRFDPNNGFRERENYGDDWAHLEKNYPLHYLADILDAAWRGPLYTILDERVWRRDESGSATGPSDYYLNEVDPVGWWSRVDGWFALQRARTQKKRQLVRAPEKLVLKCIYASIVSVAEQASMVFEVEHLVPVARISGSIDDMDPGWPISCIANLALLEKLVNRDKGFKTATEFIAHMEAGEDRDKLINMLDRYLLCELSDLTFVEQDQFSAKISKDDYLFFVDSRWQTLREKLSMAMRIQLID